LPSVSWPQIKNRPMKWWRNFSPVSTGFSKILPQYLGPMRDKTSLKVIERCCYDKVQQLLGSHLRLPYPLGYVREPVRYSRVFLHWSSKEAKNILDFNKNVWGVRDCNVRKKSVLMEFSIFHENDEKKIRISYHTTFELLQGYGRQEILKSLIPNDWNASSPEKHLAVNLHPLNGDETY